MFDELINQSLEWLKSTSNRDLFLQSLGAAGTIAGTGWAAYERFVARRNDYSEFMATLKKQGQERDKLRTERDQLQARLMSEIQRLKDVHAAEIKQLLSDQRWAGTINAHGRSLSQLSADIRILVEKATGVVFPAPEVNGHDGFGRGPLPHVQVDPNAQLPDYSNIVLVRDIASVDDDFVEFIIRRFVATYGTYAVKHGPVGIGDKVLITGQGYMETPEGGWEAHEGLVSDRYPVIIGVTMILPNFEEQLLGCMAGEKRTVSVRFPDDFYNPDGAGKYARFDLVIDEVQSPVGNLFTPELLAQLGFPSYAAFKASIRERAAAELVKAGKNRLTKRLSDALVERNTSIRVPSEMVEQLIQDDWNQAHSYGRRQEAAPEDYKSFRTYVWPYAERLAKTTLVLSALEPLAARDGYPAPDDLHPVVEWLLQKQTIVSDRIVEPTNLIRETPF